MKKPCLRFKNYEKDWQKRILGNITHFKRGYDLPSSQRIEGKHPIISSSGYSGNHSEYKAKGPGLVTGRYGSIGEIFLVNKDYWPLNTALYVDNLYDNNIHFCHFLLQTIDFKKFSDKTGVPGINRNDLHKIVKSVPSINEQQKIAEFLTTVDTKISQLTEKNLLLKEYKKGVMQQIFSQQIRFKDKDGNAFPEWKEGNLSVFSIDVIDGDRGKNYPNKAELLGCGHCLFLSAKNVTKNGFKFDETQYISEEKDANLRKGKLVSGDIVLTTRGTVGQFSYYNQAEKHPHIRINSGMVILRNKNIDIDNDYLYSALCSPEIKKQLRVLTFGSAQPQLTVKDIKNIHIKFGNIKEQQKIAHFLQAVDKKINTVAEQIEQTKQFKKGLLQQMFV